MLVAEPPCEDLKAALAPKVLLPLAAPLGLAAEGPAAPLAIPPDFAPALQSALPAATGVKPNAALAISLALHAGLVAGIIGLASSTLSSGEGDFDTIELVVEQTPEPAGAAPPQEVAKGAAAQPPTLVAPEAPERAAEAPAAPAQPLQLAELPPPAPAPDVARQVQDELRAAQAQQRLEQEKSAQERLAQEKLAQEKLAQQQRAQRREAERLRRHEAAREAAEEERVEAQRERAAARVRLREAAEQRAAQRRAQHAALGHRDARGGADRPSALPAPPPAQRARAGDAGGFDAASYRALVARAVRAAVGSRCSQAAGARVVIALSIGGSGAISGASVASSSGNAAFDAASAAAVRRAGPFPPPAGRAGVSVPVAVSCR